MVQESVGWGAWAKLSKYMGAVATTLRTHTAWSGAGDTDGAACSVSKAPAQQGGLGVRFASAKSSSDATAENLAAAADRATPRTTCSLSPSGSSGAEEEFGSDYGGEEGEQDCSGFGYTPNSDLKPCTPRTIVRSCIKKAEREANTQSWFDYYGTVGQGSFGMVELVHQRHKQASECTGGTTFAVKVCRKGTTRRQLEICRREARIMKSIPPHPFVVGLSHCVEDDGNIYMALEYCMGGDLFTHLGELGTLPERAARHLVAELTLALAHLHADGIMHRDVKPENVLLDARGHARLADFGLATSNITRADGGAMSICGSPGYIAPEVLAGRGYGLAADWWQLGMLLLEVTTGQLPWAGATLGDVSRAFRSVPLDLPAYLSSDATDFLILALCPHPADAIV